MGTTTPNYNWYKPAEHEGATGASYHIPFNANWDDLDTRFKALLDGRNADAAAIAVFQTFPVNARTYLKGDGTAEDAGAIAAFAAAAQAAGRSYIPGGQYYMPDGVSLFTALSDNMVIEGAGKGKTFISTKNAYAFKTPATGAVSGVMIRNLSTYLRSGSTSGGGIKAVSDFYHASWDIERVESAGVITCLDPPIWVDGFINSYIRRCDGNGGGGRGIFVDSAGFISNAFSISESRAAGNGSGTGGTTTGAIAVRGSLARVRDCVVESNHGYALDISGSQGVFDGNWFESNGNHNIYSNAGGGQITNNKFHYMDGTVPTAAHIILTGGTLNARQFILVGYNTFQDGSPSGVCINVGANIEDTLIIHNRGADFTSGSILNNGTRTVSYQTDNPTGLPYELKLPGGAVPMLHIKGVSQTGDSGDVTESGIFSVADAAGEEKVGVTRTGHLTQRTPNGDPGSGKVQTKGFTLFLDPADDKVKARVRNNAGAEFIHTLSN